MARSLSKKTRFEVFKRDRFACQYCGQTPPAAVLVIDHMLPVSRGGTDDEGNLVTSCHDCNAGKSDRLLTDAPAPLAEQINDRMERAEQMEAFNTFLLEQRGREDVTIRELGTRWYNRFCPEKDHFTFGPPRATGVRQFLRQLPLAEIHEAMDLAHDRFPARCIGEPWKKPRRASITRQETLACIEDDRTWRYFCGICWRKIKGDARG